MRTSLTTFLFSLAFSLTANALSLDVHEVGTGFEIAEHWKDDWGGFYRDYRSAKHILVIVRDVSRQVPAADIDVYFVGSRLPSNDRFIYAAHHEAVKLGGAIEVKGYVVAPDLTGRHFSFPALNYHSGKGALMAGWLVVGTCNGQRFDVRASNQTLLDIAASPDSFAALVGDFEKHGAKHAALAPVSPTPPPPVAPPAVTHPPATIPPQFVTLKRPVEIALPYGSAMLSAGTRLQVLDQKPDMVRVRYANVEPLIPIAFTDLTP